MERQLYDWSRNKVPGLMISIPTVQNDNTQNRQSLLKLLMSFLDIYVEAIPNGIARPTNDTFFAWSSLTLRAHLTAS